MATTVTTHDIPDELVGAIHPEPNELLFATGRLGDRRRAVTPDDAVFRLALHAYRYQDEVPGDQRRSLFGALAALWPPPSGPEKVQDERAVVAAWLLGAGVSVDELAELLDVKRDTLRRNRTIEQAAQLIQRRDAEVPLVPRVYKPDEYDTDPTLAAFNLQGDSPQTRGVVNLLEYICRRDPAIYAALGSGVTVDRVRELQRNPPPPAHPGQMLVATSFEEVQTRLAEANAVLALRGPYRLTD